MRIKYSKGDDARPSVYSVRHEMKRPYNVEQKSLGQWFNAANYLSSQLVKSKKNSRTNASICPLSPLKRWNNGRINCGYKLSKSFMRIAWKVWAKEVSYARECFLGLSEKATQLQIRPKTPTRVCKKKSSATCWILWCSNKTSTQDVWDW